MRAPSTFTPPTARAPTSGARRDSSPSGSGASHSFTRSPARARASTTLGAIGLGMRIRGDAKPMLRIAEG